MLHQYITTMKRENTVKKIQVKEGIYSGYIYEFGAISQNNGGVGDV